MKGRFKLRWVGVVILMIGLLLAGAPPGYAGETDFRDLSPEQTTYPYIKYLLERGVINGYGDGTFRPGARLSRAEISVLLVRAIGLDTASVPTSPSYEDVSPDFWGYASIEAATTQGLLKGYEDGTFRPQEPVSRVEAAAILLRLTSTPLPQVEIPAVVKDIPAGHWAEREVGVAIDAGIMPLAAKNGFAPDIPASRAEAARGLAIMMNIMPEKAHVPLVGTLVPVQGKVSLTNATGSTRDLNVPVSCTSGCSIKTGSKSAAEIRFPDGSGLKLDENTHLTIKTAEGQATILKDGSPAALIDNLEVGLSQGRILGALASTYNNEDNGENESLAHSGLFSRSGLDYSYAVASLDPVAGLLLAKDKPKKASLPWYKEPYQKKVRVKVDMPWGVAAIRGTFWMNEVLEGRQSTSVANGSVEVSSGGQTLELQAGQATQQTSAAPPPPPQPLTTQQQQIWVQAQSWITQRANSIQQSTPMVGAPPPITQQIQQAPENAAVPPAPEQAPPPPDTNNNPQPAPPVSVNQPGTGLSQQPLPGLATQIISSINQATGTGGTTSQPSSSNTSSGGSTTRDTTPPSTPSNVQAEAQGEDKIYVSWSEASDNVAVAGYQIFQCAKAEGPFTQVGTTSAGETSFQISDLAPSTKLYFQVKAVDAAGNISAASTVVSATTQNDIAQPSIPSNVQAQAQGEDKILVSWSEAADNVGVTGYHVFQATSSEEPFTQVGTTAAGVTSYLISGLAPSTTLYFQIKAVDAAGNISAASTVVSATTQNDITPPSAPTNVQAQAQGEDKILVSWSEASDNVAVTGYQVFQAVKAEGPFTQVGITGGGETSYLISNLAPSTTLYFQVKAVDAAGNISAASTVVSATTQNDITQPSIPSNIQAQAQGEDKILVSWSEAADNVGVTGYHVFQATSSEEPFTQVGIAAAGVTSYLISNLAPSTTLYFQIKAVDAAGNISAASTIVSATTPDTTAPSTPTNVQAQLQGEDQILVSWEPAIDNIGITGYLVFQATTPEEAFIQVGSTDSSETSFLISGLAPGVTLYYQVQAVDAAGNISAPSAAVSAVTAGIPSLPAAFMGTVTDGAGNPVPEGEIEVVIDGVVRASKPFRDGQFGLSLGDRLIVQEMYYANAAEIAFYVNGYIAVVNPPIAWPQASGNLTELNLIVDIEAPQEHVIQGVIM